ncbi:MAG: polysaccharide biosynthesis tyrosine autokinase [Pirellulales bacterium]
MTASTTGQNESSPQRAAHAAHAVMQFMRVVRHWRGVVVASLGAGVLLGGLYYATATRLYQAKASLLVLQTGADVNNTSMTPEGMRQGLMPTYERLFHSASVLDGAVKYLQLEDRIDLDPNHPDTWVNAIHTNLTAVTIRQTNIIEVSYRSKSARASVAVINAVLRSYFDFMEKTHKGTAGEIITALTKDKAQLEEQLSGKQEEVSQVRRKCGDLGIRNDSTVVHPMVQRVVALNEALIGIQQKRLELQASLASVGSAIRNGENLQQHFLALETSVGREVLLSGLGLSSRDGVAQSNMEKSLLDDEAQLTTLRAYFGPMHPRVMELVDRIRITNQYLAEYRTRVGQRMNQMRDGQLGQVLVQMVQQRLNETWEHERALRANFEAARAEAVAYTGELEHLQILEHDLKFLHDFRDVLLEKIASIDLKQNHSDIRTAVVSEPVLPKGAVWPKIPLIAVFSVAGGLGLGLALVYVLDILDDRWRSPDELRTRLGAPVLAVVRQMRELHSVGLEAVQMHASPDSAETEAFRTLRTTLAFSSHDSTRIVVTSAEPKDGKTTVLSNLAVACVQSGKKILVIDADMRRPGLSSLMGVKGHKGLSDILVSSTPLTEIIAQFVSSSGLSGLDVLPAGPRRPNPSELLSSPRMADLLAWAETVYDQVLIDSPPVLVASDTSIVGRLVDGVVFVVQPNKNRRRLVMRAAETLTGVGIKLLGIVVNRVGADSNDVYGYGAGYGYGYGQGDTQDAEEGASADATTATDPQTTPAGLYVRPLSKGARGPRTVPRRAA